MLEQRVEEGDEERSHRRLTAWAARALAIGGSMALMSVLVVGGSRAAFNATTSNGANNFAAGTVVLGNDSAGSVMFNMSGMKPGDTATKCINVGYTGSLPADVHLYGSVGGTLGAYLDTTVDIGSGAAGGATSDCTGFASPSTLYTGTLTGFGTAHANFGNGAAGNDNATNPTVKSYRITVTLQDNNAAQGQSSTATFTWEAQNV
jgi:hypothetical protein